MKKTSFATHSKEVGLAECGSNRVQMTIEDIKPGKFYVCQCYNDWYFSVVKYVPSEHGDVNMKFLTLKALQKNYFGHNVTMPVGF